MYTQDTLKRDTQEKFDVGKGFWGVVPGVGRLK